MTAAVMFSVLLSCSKKPEIQVREVDYLNKSQELLKSVPVDMDMPMLTYGVIHCDSLNILMTQDPRGYMFVYSDDWKLLGTFCHQGRAQYEFVDRPSLIKNQVLLGKDNHLLLPLQDATCIKVVDVTEEGNRIVDFSCEGSLYEALLRSVRYPCPYSPP